MRFSDIKKFVSEKFQLKIDYLRLFNAEGVEIMEDDLEFLKNNTSLFVSKGEEYDSNSSFA